MECRNQMQMSCPCAFLGAEKIMGETVCNRSLEQSRRTGSNRRSCKIEKRAGTSQAGARCGGKVFVRKLQKNYIDGKCDNLLRYVSLAQREGGIIMYLWFMEAKDRYWGSYVIESTRGKAKARFYRYFGYFGYIDYTDIRCVKIKSADGYEPAMLDDADDPRLVELGVEYVDPDKIGG